MISAILKYSIGSLVYGGLITVIFLALFIFLIKGWYKDAVFKPISFIVFGVLALVILWNSTIICGALAIKSDISSMQVLIEDIIQSLDLDGNSMATASQVNEIFQEVVDQHPILDYYADCCDSSGLTIARLPKVMCDTLKDYLNDIILKSLLWSLGFILAGAVIVIKTLDRTSRNTYKSHRTAGNADRSRAVASRYNGRRRSSRN